MSALHTSNNNAAPTAVPADDMELGAEAARIAALVAGQYVLSQSRCVDHVLDLMNLTTEPAVRAVLVDFLRDMRHTSAVEAAAFCAVLDVVVVAAEVESAYAHLILG